MIEAEGKIELHFTSDEGFFSFRGRRGGGDLRKVGRSSIETIGQYSWSLKFFEGDEENKIVIRCDQLSLNLDWKCVANISVQFIGSDQTGKYTRNVLANFDSENMSYNVWDLVPFCYRNHGPQRCIIVANINIMDSNRLNVVRNPERFDVDSYREGVSDLCLIVEKKKLYVKKSYLTINSSYFASMLKPEFAGENCQEITVNEVEFDDFRMFLRLIFPTSENICEHNFVRMMELADFYDAPAVMAKCEAFLLGLESFDVTSVKKLFYAEKYKMYNLEMFLINYLNTASFDVVKKMLQNPNLENLSMQNQLRIHRRLTTIQIQRDEFANFESKGSSRHREFHDHN